MAQNYKYFIYSSEQLKFEQKMAEKSSKRYKVGIVVSNGKRKSFTEMNNSGISRYSDATIVAQGDVSSLKYTLPKGE